jgi:hypothetical protein
MKKTKAKIYPSMSAASAGMSIPLPLLKRLKAANCPGFDRSGRVDETVVASFIEENPELLSTAGLPAGYDPLKSAQIEKIIFDLEVKKGKFVPFEEVKEGLAQVVQISQGVMRDFLEKSVQNKAFSEYKKRLKEMDL